MQTSVARWQHASPLLALILLLAVSPAPAQQQPDAPPVNADATPDARALLRQLDALSGRAILDGEHNYPNTISRYTDRVYDLTDKYPAIFGQDFGFAGGNDKDSVLSRPAMIQEVIRQYRNGAIPALCWHAVPPTKDEPVTFQQDILSHLTDYEWQQLLTPGTDLHARWERQVDRIAGYLRELEDAGVPVLFRPYHEMNGNWFWWGGRPGPNGTAALYRMLFDRYVHVHHLNNLLWVWNVAASSSKSGPPAAYWPGPAYADVVTMDIYRPFTQTDYASMLQLAGDGKPIALAEVGTLPSAEVLARQPRWTYLMVWAEFAEDHNTLAQLRSTLNAPGVISRGDARLALPSPVPPTPSPRNLHATTGARELLAQLAQGTPHVVEIDLTATSPQHLAAQLQAAAAAHQVPLLRWLPPSPTGDRAPSLTDFEWRELRTPGSPLHARWLGEIESLGRMLQALPPAAILFSPLPGANGSAWWSRPGPEGSQALWLEVQHGLSALHRDNLLWVWEPAADLPDATVSPAALLESFFPGPLGVDAFLLDASVNDTERGAMMDRLKSIAAGQPLGLRTTGPDVQVGVPYQFLVTPTLPASPGSSTPAAP